MLGDYVAAFAQLQGHASYINLNMSCPNSANWIAGNSRLSWASRRSIATVVRDPAPDKSAVGGPGCARHSTWLRWSGCDTTRTLAAFHARLIAAGKRPKVALVACMHKLLLILNAIIRTNQPWHDDQAPASI